VRALIRERRDDAEGIVGTRSPHGRQEADGFVPQTPDDELQHADGRRIHPLSVVDGHDDGRDRRRRADAPEDRERHGPLVGARTRSRREQERDLEGLALRPRERRQTLLEHGFDQVPEGRVRQTGLGLHGDARDDPVAAVAATREAPLPDGRLPDAGITRQQQGARAGRDRVEEPIEDRELRLASDDVTRHSASLACVAAGL